MKNEKDFVKEENIICFFCGKKETRSLFIYSYDPLKFSLPIPVWARPTPTTFMWAGGVFKIADAKDVIISLCGRTAITTCIISIVCIIATITFGCRIKRIRRHIFDQSACFKKVNKWYTVAIIVIV